MYQTVRRLAERADVEVFAPHPRYFKWARSQRVVGEFDPAFQPHGTRTHYLHYPAIPVVSRRLNGYSAARVLFDPIRRFNPDVIFSYFLYPDGFAALRVGRHFGTPVVVKAIGSDVNAVPAASLPSTRRVLTHADRILTVSAALRDKAIELGAPPDATVSILNGCDGDVFRVRDRNQARHELEVPANAEVVLYAGRLDLKKGLAELIQAASQLRIGRPRLLTVLIGEGPDEGAVRELIRKHSVEAAVRLMGPKTSIDVSQWMTASDVVTLPSYAEGCPNVVIEALSCGRPVVATNVGGIPELMDESCGAMVPSRNVAALASALDATLGREWLADDIAAKHRRTWEEVADDTLEVLRQVVEARSRRSGDGR
ncbi:MAG: hypothetical protein NVS9B15_18020 [Acidobacteriaceae bacterium]